MSAFSTVVTDLRLWHLGPGHPGAIVAVATEKHQEPNIIAVRLAGSAICPTPRSRSTASWSFIRTTRKQSLREASTESPRVFHRAHENDQHPLATLLFRLLLESIPVPLFFRIAELHKQSSLGSRKFLRDPGSRFPNGSKAGCWQRGMK